MRFPGTVLPSKEGGERAEFRPGVHVTIDLDGEPLPGIGVLTGEPTDLGTRLVEFDPPLTLPTNTAVRVMNTNGAMSGVAYCRLD